MRQKERFNWHAAAVIVYFMAAGFTAAYLIRMLWRLASV